MSPLRLNFRRLCGLLAALCFALVAPGCRSDGAAGVAQPQAPGNAYQPQEGDVLFQSLPHNPLIDAIEGATESPYSHCGIVHRTSRGTWVVIEAIGPVRETSLNAWIGQGRASRYSAYRLRTEYQAKVGAFIAAAQGYEGRPYDIHYDLDDKAIYCSELIYKAFRTATGEELGKLQKLGDLKWQAHTAVIKQIEGGTVPLERQMITPRALSEARQLEEVRAW